MIFIDAFFHNEHYEVGNSWSRLSVGLPVNYVLALPFGRHPTSFYVPTKNPEAPKAN
jgi:hypothetical protein